MPRGIALRARDVAGNVDTVGPDWVGPARAANGPGPGVPFGPLETLDHYLLIDELGRGGMGTVLAAYDLALDRKVAIKRLRDADRDDERLRRAITRSWREARALASLSHPNVVQLHEVGDDRGVPYLVMELVEGPNLSEWSRQRPRRPAEVLHMLVEAGHGLAAAHAAGVWHRDFKPSNVVVGADGRPRVVDFGLAKLPADAAQIPGDIPIAMPVPKEPAGTSLTRTGALLGTPAYVAPERLDDSAAGDHHADQYAFCVAAWELLCGSRPFAGKDGAMHASKMWGPPPWPRSHRKLRRIGAVLRRGLAPEPADRWPSMTALLAALRPAPARRRHATRVGAGIAAVVLAAAAAGVVLAPDDSGGPVRRGLGSDACASVHAAMLRSR